MRVLNFLLFFIFKTLFLVYHHGVPSVISDPAASLSGIACEIAVH